MSVYEYIPIVATLFWDQEHFQFLVLWKTDESFTHISMSFLPVSS